MGDDKPITSKRNRKAPVRFQPWQVGDAHSPMALRSQKSKLKKDQKRFRDMKKAGVKDTNEDASSNCSNKQEKIPKQKNPKKLVSSKENNDKQAGAELCQAQTSLS